MSLAPLEGDVALDLVARAIADEIWKGLMAGEPDGSFSSEDHGPGHEGMASRSANVDRDGRRQSTTPSRKVTR